MIGVTESPTEIQIDWEPIVGANEYIVYRGELGCDRQQVPVARLSAATTLWLEPSDGSGLPRTYRVEAVGTNTSCRSAISACAAILAGPRLQMNDHGMIETGANVNGNGFLDPGETVQVPVTLFNSGTADAFGVSARLRTIDPAQGRIVDPVVGFTDMPPGSELASAAPHFEMTLFEDGVACGETVELELEMRADSAAARSQTFSFVLGEKERDYPASASLVLSRFNTNPVVSTFAMTYSTVIGDLDISVNIDHTRPGDLIVELSSPQGTTVRLHDLSPGTGGIFTRYDLLTLPDGPGVMADFEGESAAGTWTLSVQNTVFGGGNGTFQNWTVHVTSEGAFDCSVLNCAAASPALPVDGFHVGRALDGGDGSIDLAFSWDAVGSVDGYHVLQSTAAPFDVAVDLTGRTSGSTALVVEDGAVSTPPLTFFQVRAINSCNEESP